MKKIRNKKELISLLEKSNVPLERWGKGPAKTIENLWQEIVNGEAKFEGRNPPLRILRVAQIIIMQEVERNLILIEKSQILADGRERIRNEPPGEKMHVGENVRDAALRCLKEEFNFNADVVDFLSVSEEPYIVEKKSPSFPGLRTNYHFYRVEVVIKNIPSTKFQTEEGNLIHVWDWEIRDTSLNGKE